MVKWTAHAKRQLRHIHDYIAQDSPPYAKQVAQDLVRKSMTLDALPRIGRVGDDVPAARGVALAEQGLASPHRHPLRLLLQRVELLWA